jgi:hypothetical protein
MYFAIHNESDPKPLRTDAFIRNLERCDTFLFDYGGEKWYLPNHDPDKEANYNKLSQGELQPPIDGADLKPFTLELQGQIHNKKKKIVLERTPVDPVDEKTIPELIKLNLDDTINAYRDQIVTMSKNIVSRDESFLELIKAELKDGKRAFAFLGAAHEAHMRQLLMEECVQCSLWTRYETPQPNELPLVELTEKIGINLSRTQVMRKYLSALNGTPPAVVGTMTEQQLRSELTNIMKSAA